MRRGSGKLWKNCFRVPVTSFTRYFSGSITTPRASDRGGREGGGRKRVVGGGGVNVTNGRLLNQQAAFYYRLHV